MDKTSHSWVPAMTRGLVRILFAIIVVVSGTQTGLPAAVKAASSGWVTVASMSSAHYAHTATLLQNGKVLVAGGSAGGAQNSSVLYDPGSGTWSNTGDMNVGRFGHTATVLPNGKVLVAGGSGASGKLISSELYDPTSGTWTAADNLNVARSAHTATLLPDGSVLVIGGEVSPDASLNSVELYNPAANTWTSKTVGLSSARSYHTATLMPDGQVLVVGGRNGISILNSVELYNPSGSGAATTRDPLLGVRWAHTASLLTNGKVLVAGGQSASDGGALDSAELYDGAGNPNWTATGSLTAGRALHTATVLPSGKVLVTGGGETNIADDEYVFIGSAEIFTPDGTTEGGAWAPASDMATTRGMHTATLLPNGSVLIAGGMDTDTVSLPSAEIFSMSNDSGNTADNMNNARYSHTATLLPDGTVLVAGGTGTAGTNALKTAEIYDPAGSWSYTTGEMNQARVKHTATLLGSGKVLVTGGQLGNGATWLASAELYDPQTKMWTQTATMHTSRSDHTATLLANGKVLVVGGLTNLQNLNSAEIYDPASETWTPARSMSTNRYNHTATLLPNGNVLVIGGWNDALSGLKSSEIYFPATNSWWQLNAGSSLMNTGRGYHTSTLLSNGNILVAGGLTSTGPTDTCEIFNPNLNQWLAPNAVRSLNNSRAFHSAVLLQNGKVLVLGGTDFNEVYQSAELYDPLWNIEGTSPATTTEKWTMSTGMVSGRKYQTSTLLPDGRILTAGGSTAANTLFTSELYDPGSGYDNSWRPVISSMPSTVKSGHSITLGGSLFRGYQTMETGGSGTSGSATNYPLVQIRHLDNDQIRWLMPDAVTGFSATSIKTMPIGGMPPGPALVTVYVNGIPSLPKMVQIELNYFFLPSAFKNAYFGPMKKVYLPSILR